MIQISLNVLRFVLTSE